MKDGKLCSSKKRLQGTVPTKRQRKAVQLYGKGLTFFEAFTAAGYSPKQARKGSALFRQHPGLQIALAQEMESFPPDVRANLTRLRLVNNALTGEDRAVQSCKLMGQDRELNLWSQSRGQEQSS